MMLQSWASFALNLSPRISQQASRCCQICVTLAAKNDLRCRYSIWLIREMNGMSGDAWLWSHSLWTFRAPLPPIADAGIGFPLEGLLKSITAHAGTWCRKNEKFWYVLYWRSENHLICLENTTNNFQASDMYK